MSLPKDPTLIIFNEAASLHEIFRERFFLFEPADSPAVYWTTPHEATDLVPMKLQQIVTTPPPGNRHERRKAAALERMLTKGPGV